MRNYFITPTDIFYQRTNDPIIDSLLDLDVYKFSMGQLIWAKEEWRNTIVTFSLTVRTKNIHLAEVIPLEELKAQLDHIRKIRITEAELAYLRGMPLGEEKNFLLPSFLQFLKGLKLPEYDLQIKDGQLKLSFTGKWAEVTYWETIAMSVLSEMYYNGLHHKYPLKAYEFMATYAQMIQRIQESISVLKTSPLTFSEFGTRRRHSRKWQRLVLNVFEDMLPGQLTGSSNVLLSMQHGSSNPKGTNAHELPMGLANLTDDSDNAIRQSQYAVVEEWYKMFPELSIILPDTFGTTQFLQGAPHWLAEKCIGARIDSKDPETASQEFIEWWINHGVDPKTKMLIASDGLDPSSMIRLYDLFGKKVKNYTFGLGTMATNNCGGTWAGQIDPGFRPFSMVIKMTRANGKPTVKLSDNPSKAIGDPERVERFQKIFGIKGIEESTVLV